jgi:hypothetical protein
MELRAASARSLLTPLAVLVPILATVVFAAWAFTTWPPLALVAISGGLAVTAVAGRYTCGVRTALVSAAFTLLAAVVALPLWYALAINTSICGKTVDSAWEWLPPTVGVLVFFAMGSRGFRTDRASSMVPMALLFGILVTLLLVAAVPGTQGACES